MRLSSGATINTPFSFSKRPIDPAANITPADRPTLKDYCINDLNTTIDMYFQLKPQIDLRVAMSAKYDIDLRSKSDAQIAEAVIRQEVQKKVGRKIYRPDISPDYTFKYRIPEFVSFTAPGMQKVLEIIRNARFLVLDISTSDSILSCAAATPVCCDCDGVNSPGNQPCIRPLASSIRPSV